MDETKKEKIKRFINDDRMQSVVYDVLLDSFLQSSESRDVQMLAAERIAIDNLKNAWKRLKRISIEEKLKEEKITNNQGL